VSRVGSVRALVFDLDGTLVDSAPGILRCLRQALAEVAPGEDPNFPSDLVGPSVREMLARLLPHADEAVVDAGVRAFRRCYDGGGWRDAVPYWGVHAMLETLRSAGIRLFIVTNKPRVPTDRILAHFGWQDLFDAVVCRDDTAPPFPDKRAALARLVEDESLAVDCALFVGDTTDDAAAAEACGIAFVFAAYGYGEGRLAARALSSLDSPAALVAFLQRRAG